MNLIYDENTKLISWIEEGKKHDSWLFMPKIEDLIFYHHISSAMPRIISDIIDKKEKKKMINKEMWDVIDRKEKKKRTNREICKGLKPGDDILVKDDSDENWKEGAFVEYNEKRNKILATINGAFGVFSWDMISVNSNEPEENISRLEIEPGTLVEVRAEGGEWYKRKFVMYWKDLIIVESKDGESLKQFHYIRLIKEEEKVDWSKVKMGDIIEVRNAENGCWVRMRFLAAYDDRIYAINPSNCDSVRSWKTGRLLKR